MRLAPHRLRLVRTVLLHPTSERSGRGGQVARPAPLRDGGDFTVTRMVGTDKWTAARASHRNLGHTWAYSPWSCQRSRWISPEREHPITRSVTATFFCRRRVVVPFACGPSFHREGGIDVSQ